MKQEETMEEVRQFFDIYRKEIGNSIRAGSRVVTINFLDLNTFSPKLGEKLINFPLEVLQALETSLEDMGLIKGARVLLSNIPDICKVKLGELGIRNLNKLVKVEGVISEMGPIKHRVLSIKFECPSCGSIISVQQMEKFHGPSKCSCGRKGNFTIISREMEDYKLVSLRDDKNNEVLVNFDNLFFNSTSGAVLKEGLIISVIGIVSESNSQNSLDVEFIIMPSGLEIVRELKNEKIDTEEFLNSLKSIGSNGPFIFEEFIGKLFTKKGYLTKVTRKTGDFGIDVLATKGAEKLAIQCKLNSKEIKVSNTLIQKALGALASPYNCNRLIFVTTAEEYTSQAIEQIKNSKIPIELWNRKKLIAEVDAHMHNLEEGWTLLNEIEEKNKNSFIPEIKSFEIDRIATTFSPSQRSKVLVVREALTKLEERLGKFIPLEELEKELAGKLTKEEINESISRLTASGDVFIPRKGFVQRI